MTFREPDQDVILAATDLVRRCGAKELTFGHLHDGVPIEQAAWWAKAVFGGAVVMTEGKTGPEEALTALAERLLTGAQCQRCGGLVQLREEGATAFPDAPRPDGKRWSQKEIEDAGLCRWRREGPKWQFGCARAPEPGDELHTTEELARALEATNDIRVKPLVWKARRGYYHDFLSPLALPEAQLVNDLLELGLTELAQRVIDGEFDASTAESDAWGRSEEGRATYAALLASSARPASPTGAEFWTAQRPTTAGGRVLPRAAGTRDATPPYP